MGTTADSNGARSVLRRLRADADRLAHDLAVARLNLAEAVVGIDSLDPDEVAEIAGMTVPAACRMIEKGRR